MRRRGNVLALVLVLAVGLAGCGGSDDEKSTADAVRSLIESAGTESAQATVESFFKAGNERDAKTICGLLTEEQAQAFGRATGGDCESGMAAVFEARDPPRTDVIIEDVRVRGSRATVDVTITQGGETRPSSLDLIQEDGDWKLADPGI
jgi:hypothetical protein